MALTIDIHSDVICPWCWIGKRRLEQALAAVPGAAGALVRWHPFQLNPAMPAAGMPRAEYRQRKFGSADYAQALDARVTGVAAAEGLAFDLAGQARTPNTVLAHRLIWLAGQRGRQDALVEALFSAYFGAGLDVGDPAVLERLAAGHGFAAGEAARFLASREGAAEVAAEEADVRTRGIDGVPLYRIGGERIAGAQPVAVFVAALSQAAAAAEEGSGDCADGFCSSDGG